jgi:general secretion pathway protein A
VYLDYYGLNEPPFDITPNPRFLFYSAKHREAFNHLLYGVRERKGFVQLTGEVGAGKTTLCRAMLEQLNGHYSTALILNPVLRPDELIKAIAIEFGLDVKGMDRLETVAAINHFLLWQVEQGKDAVLIIDEAQSLSEEMLEQIRLLSEPGDGRAEAPADRADGPAGAAPPPEQPEPPAIAPAHYRALSPVAPAPQ